MFANSQKTSSNDIININDNPQTNVLNSQSSTPDIFKGASLYDLIHLNLNGPSIINGNGCPNIVEDGQNNIEMNQQNQIGGVHGYGEQGSNKNGISSGPIDLLSFIQDAIKKNNIGEDKIDVQMLDNTTNEHNDSIDEYQEITPNDGLNMGDRVALQIQMESVSHQPNNLYSRNHEEQQEQMTNQYFLSNQQDKMHIESVPTDAVALEIYNSKVGSPNYDLNERYPIDEQNFNSGTMTPTLQDLRSDNLSEAMSLDDQIRDRLQEVRAEKIFSNTQGNVQKKKSQQRTGIRKQESDAMSPKINQQKNSNMGTPMRSSQHSKYDAKSKMQQLHIGPSSPKTVKHKYDFLQTQSPRARQGQNLLASKTPRDNSQSVTNSMQSKLRSSKSNMRASTHQTINIDNMREKIDRNQVMTPQNCNTDESINNRFEKLALNRPKSTHQKSNVQNRIASQVQNSNIKPSYTDSKNYSSIKSTEQNLNKKSNLNPQPKVINLNDSDDQNPYSYPLKQSVKVKDSIHRRQANQLKQSPGGQRDFNKYDPSSIQNSVSSLQANLIKEIQSLDKHLALKNPQNLKKTTKNPTRKQQMQCCISKFNIGAINEFQRIKKPQKQALIIGKLTCILVCTFRNPPLSEDYTFEMVQIEFDKWESIQYFLLSNLNRTFNEIQQIKQRALSKSNINLNFAKSLIKMIAENESHLKNIPNQSLKQVFEMITRTLIYVEYKHIKARNSKKSSKDNSDLNMRDNLSQEGNNQNATEEDEEEDNEDEFLDCINELEANQLYDQSALSIPSKNANDRADDTLKQFEESINQSLSEVTVNQDTHFMNSSNYMTPDPNKYNLPLQRGSSPSKFMSPPRESQNLDQKLKKLQQNYTNQNYAMREVKKSPNIKHKFISSSQPFTNPQSNSNYLSQIESRYQQQHAIKEISVNLESQQNFSENSISIDQVPKDQAQKIQPNVELKVELYSEQDTMTYQEQKSFIDKRASEIIQDLMTIQNSSNSQTIYQIPQASINLYTQHQQQLNADLSDEHLEFKAVDSQLDLKNSHLISSSSAKHSRRSSMKINQPPQTLQQSDIDDTPNSPDSDGSPYSPQTNKSSKTTSGKVTKKKAKELSPTQKLIRFKNKSYKSKVKEQKQLNTQQSTNTGSSSQKNQTSAKKPTFDYPLQEQKKSMQTNSNYPKVDKNLTPHSVTSTQRFDDLQFQIHMSNKDIFNIEDNTSNSDGTYRNGSQSNSMPQSRIQVYENNTPHDSQPISIDDGFYLRLLKVDDPTQKITQLHTPQVQPPQIISSHNLTFQSPSIIKNDTQIKPQNESFISSNSKKGINMNLIEELKQRRLNQMREREEMNGNYNSSGQPSYVDSQILSQKRDDMIKKIQDDIADQLVKKIRAEENGF
eukprot:403346571